MRAPAPAARPLLLLCLLLMPLSCNDGALATVEVVDGMACLILELDDPVLYA